MRWSILFVFYFALASSRLVAQQHETALPNQIKFTAFRLVDIVNPGVELSYERLYGDIFSTQVSAAYMSDLFHITPYFNYSGYRLGIEEKVYFSDFPYRRPYASVDFAISHTRMHTSAEFGIDWPFDSANYVDTFGAIKNMVTAQLKTGVQILNISPHAVMDLYAGLGVKYKTVTHFDRNVPTDKMVHPRESFVNYQALAEQRKYTMTMALGVRFGFCF